MAFKLLFASIIIITTITVIFNSSSFDNKNSAAQVVSFKKIPTKKEFTELCKRRRCHMKKSTNYSTAAVLLYILLLSGDIEVNPGPWTCSRCNQLFKHQQKFNNHIANQETVSCRYCNSYFCSTRRCQGHERTCPTRITTPAQRADSSSTGPWKCARCDQSFERYGRYESHLTNQEFISCRHCQRNFCRRDRLEQHERSEHPPKPTNTSQPAIGGAINLDIPIIGNTKYQKMKGRCDSAKLFNQQTKV